MIARPLHRFRLNGRAALLGTIYAAGLSGCYRYTARAGTQDSVAGGQVRVTLTDLGSVQLTAQVGPRVESIDGVLQRSPADSVIVLATRTVAENGRETPWGNERLAIPQSAVASLRVRQLDGTRTALAGVVGVGLVVLLILVSRASGGNTDTGAGGQIPSTQ